MPRPRKVGAVHSLTYAEDGVCANAGRQKWVNVLLIALQGSLSPIYYPEYGLCAGSQYHCLVHRAFTRRYAGSDLITITRLFGSAPAYGLFSYERTKGTTGLAYLGAGICSMIGTVIRAKFLNRSYRHMTRQYKKKHNEPEERHMP